jgi:hypothetical protein
MSAKSTNYEEKKLLASTEEIRAALAKRIIGFLGKSEDQATAIPGVSIYRRDHPTGPIFGLYEPSLTLLVQGRKRVMLGQEAFGCGPSRYLLTSLNVPVIGQVVEASPGPYLCLFLKLDLGAARQLLIDHDLPVQSRPSSGRGIATGSAALELLMRSLVCWRLPISPKTFRSLALLYKEKLCIDYLPVKRARVSVRLLRQAVRAIGPLRPRTGFEVIMLGR